MARYKIRDCKHCGEAYVGHPASRFCSPECKTAHHAPASREAQCPGCGASFTTTRSDQKFCSLKCKKAHEALEYRRLRDAPEKVCARNGCGVVFVGPPKQKYCCKECYKKSKSH